MTIERTPQIHHTPEFITEGGVRMQNVRQAYYLDGQLNESGDNAVVIFHALTGSADAVGDWWNGVIGPELAIDTDEYAVLCVNFVGSCYGSTGPLDYERGDFPALTTRDLARLVMNVARDIGIRHVRLAAGGSLGGMVALEWAATFPSFTERTIVFAAPAHHTAAAIGWSHIQRQMIAAGGDRGLEIARMVAMMTYRTAAEFEMRFGRDKNPDGSYRAESYLSRHGEKLLARFNIPSYLALLDTMDSHDVTRSRGADFSVLAEVGDRLVGVGIPGDLLYREEDVLAWVRASGAEFRQVHSIRGHDAFLLEPRQVGAIFREALGVREPVQAGHSA